MKVRVFSLRGLKKACDFLFVVGLSLLCVLLSFSIMLDAFATCDAVLTSMEGEKPLVVIDAGHGGEDVGAIGYNGVYEKDLNLEIAFQIGEMLINEGYLVFYTRTEDKLLYTQEQNIKGVRKVYDLKNRVAIVNEKNPYIFLSIHMNFFAEEKYAGFEVYYRTGDESSRTLACDVSEEVRLAVYPENKRTPKATNDMYLLKNTSCTAILIECGFLSNEAECKKLCEKEYQKELSFSIVCGMIRYESRNDS